MKIGDLARCAGCTVETIRYYERQGLMAKPGRTAGNYRSYGTEDASRLRFIRNCRRFDMTHEEIRALLAAMDTPADDCGGVNAILDEHIEHIGVRIAELQMLERQLRVLRRQCDTREPVSACGIVKELVAMQGGAMARGDTHLE